MKIAHDRTNELVRKVLLCKYLNLKPDEVDNLTLEDYTLFGEIVIRLDGKRVL